MDLTQKTFLAHYMPTIIAFWLYCWYYSAKKKKLTKRCKRNVRQREIIQ